MEQNPLDSGKDLVQKTSEAIEKPEPQIPGMGALADQFIEVCSINLDQNLTPESIRDKLTTQGFPIALAVSLGRGLLDRIEDVRNTLLVASTKPKQKDSLVAAVRDETTEYFTQNQENIDRFFMAIKNPVASLDVAVNVLSKQKIEGLSPEDLKTFLDAIQRLLEEGTQKFLESLGQTFVLLAKEKLEEDAKIEENSSGGIYLIFDSEKNRESFFTYLKSIFPSLKFHPERDKVTDKKWKITFSDNTRDRYFSSLRRR